MIERGAAEPGTSPPAGGELQQQYRQLYCRLYDTVPRLLFAVAMAAFVGGLLAVTSLSDAVNSGTRRSRESTSTSQQVHPQCQAPYLLLGHSSAQDEGRIELTAQLPTATECHWDADPPPRNGTAAVRRCGATSQTGMWGPGEPSLAIDGSYAHGMLDVPACSHTGASDASGSWWQVDLQAFAEVESVQIWGREDCCTDRLGWASVVVSATTDFTDKGFVCSGTIGNFFQGDRAETFDCSDATGQYITVTMANPLGGGRMSESNVITICELNAQGRFIVTGGTGQRNAAQDTSRVEFQRNESICATWTTGAQWRELRQVYDTTAWIALGPHLGFQPARSCGHSDNISDGAWYRFAGAYDALPTEPMRLSVGRDSYSCGTLSSAWVSGWDASLSAEAPPPVDYRKPGAYPGQGPQYIDSDVQQRVLCFEGWWPPSSEIADDGDGRWQYHSCGESRRVAIVHCGTFLLWQLPPPPSVVEPMQTDGRARTNPTQGYCTIPSGLFGSEPLNPRWSQGRG